MVDSVIPNEVYLASMSVLSQVIDRDTRVSRVVQNIGALGLSKVMVTYRTKVAEENPKFRAINTDGNSANFPFNILKFSPVAVSQISIPLFPHSGDRGKLDLKALGFAIFNNPKGMEGLYASVFSENVACLFEMPRDRNYLIDDLTPSSLPF